MNRILLIDAEPTHGEVLKDLFAQHNFELEIAHTARKGIKILESEKPQLVILDLALPDLSGEELCRAIRAKSKTPIIILSARDSEIDIVVGLELGADDYLSKPYSNAELMARIRAVLRRTRQPAHEVIVDSIEAGPVRLDKDWHTVSIRGEIVPFGPREFQLLEALLANAGRVLSRSQLADMVWGSREFAVGKSLDVLVKRIRSKIEQDPDNPIHLRTVRGAGYLLEK